MERTNKRDEDLQCKTMNLLLTQKVDVYLKHFTPHPLSKLLKILWENVDASKNLWDLEH